MNDDVRRHFPILDQKAYFNGCSYGPISLEVKAAIEQYIQIRMEEGARWDIYCDKIERVRELVATMLQTPVDDVSISKSVSESLKSWVNLVVPSTPRVTLPSFSMITCNS